MKRFHTASEEEILKGRTTDVYFQRTIEILRKKGIKKRVVAEFVVKKFPDGYEWGVLAGIEECIGLLTSLRVNSWSMEEGTFFRTGEPVLVIEGEYTAFGVYETALLGLICQASGIATKAARCRKIAKDKTLISFGARRMHPSISPMIERNAYIGGFDGVATLRSAELLNLEPTGTMPHSLILIMGNSALATKAFDEVIEPKIKRIALIDTLEDEKFEAMRVAEALGKRLYGVRLDTPSSRRGNFFELIKEVRWELDMRGYKDIKIFVSGGMDEEEIEELNGIVDGYGVGTSISNARVLDFAMDIVEIEKRPIAKRGKPSGRKRVLRCEKCYKSLVIPFSQKRVPRCECGGKYQDLLKPLTREGRLVRELKSPDDIRNYVLKQLQFYKI